MHFYCSSLRFQPTERFRKGLDAIKPLIILPHLTFNYCFYTCRANMPVASNQVSHATPPAFLCSWVSPGGIKPAPRFPRLIPALAASSPPPPTHSSPRNAALYKNISSAARLCHPGSSNQPGEDMDAITLLSLAAVGPGLGGCLALVQGVGWGKHAPHLHQSC